MSNQQQQIKTVRTTVLTREQLWEIVDYLNQGKKVCAIKSMREYSGLGLQDSKNMVNGMCSAHLRTDKVTVTAPEVTLWSFIKSLF